jgi:hypothetical protein
MFQTKFVEKIKTQFVFSDFFLNCAVCEILCKNTVERGRPRDSVLQRMRIACWIPQATNIHIRVV